MQNPPEWKKIKERISEDKLHGWSDSAPEYLLDRYSRLVAECEAVGNWTTLDRFMRFITATEAMEYFAYTRELTEIHAWFVRSLNDTYVGGPREEVALGLPDQFINDPVISQCPDFSGIMVRWLGSAYYYFAEQSALDDFGVAYFDLAIRFCFRENLALFDTKQAFLLSRLMTWTLQTSHPAAKQLTSMCEALVFTATVPFITRASLAFTLATRTGRLSKLTQTDWANFTLANFRHVLTSQEKLALLATPWDGLYQTTGEDMLAEITNMRGEMLYDAVSKLTLRVLEDGRAEIIKPMLALALQSGNFTFVNSATAIWYGANHEGVLEAENILWQVPLYNSGYLGMLATEHISLARDSDLMHTRLVRAENRFKGSSITVRGAPSAEMHIPERMGHPSYEYAKEFESALIQAYLSPEITAWLSKLSHKISSQVALPSNSHPIQAVQMKVLGTTWPLAASFTSPLPDAVVSKVAIWSSGGLMSPNHEIDALRQVFENGGISVDVYISGEAHGKHFSEIYSDESYQILWLIGHGEYDHFSPKEATLEVGGEGQYVGMAELLDTKLNLSARRLLMLNVCDGASHPGNGVLPRLGFAASLAASWQATISHKWPVAPIAAAVLGVLLASHIVKGDSFFDAYRKMIAEMLEASDLFAVADRIDSAAGSRTDLADRLRYTSQSLCDFGHYASAAFFE